MSATVGLLEHFRKLFDFRGREDRASFWPYAALVFGITIMVSTAMFVPLMERSVRVVQVSAARQHEGQITAVYRTDYPNLASGGPAQILHTGWMATYLWVTFGLAVLLYSSAVARRLHDRGRSGAWGLMPLPFILYSTVMMPRMFGSFGTGKQPNTTLFFTIFFSNAFYMVALIALIVLLAGGGEPQPNRYDQQSG